MVDLLQESHCLNYENKDMFMLSFPFFLLQARLSFKFQSGDGRVYLSA